METRTIVFGLAGLVFAGHVLAGKSEDAGRAQFEKTPWKVTEARSNPTSNGNNADSGAGRVTVDVFNITRGSAGVKVRNTSGTRLASVFLECTFRDQYGARIDSVPVFVSNLASGDTANEVAAMPNDVKASTVDCRTEYTRGS